MYHDPGDPCYIDAEGNNENDDYQWNFALVAHWSSHLDPSDGVQWNISPARIGNLTLDDFPTTIAGLRDFYQDKEGGDPSPGYALNPSTNQPYAPQVVARGDYTRVLAEFWADGPNSETPPGHWFTILNYINDHPQLEKKFRGEGETVDPLEWDVKSYFMLGGAMHDVAITVWSIKGYYDFIRPISAIRYMADRGQSSTANLPHYHPNGLPLEEGYVELVAADDPLAGADGEHVGKVKVSAWRGPESVPDTTGIAMATGRRKRRVAVTFNKRGLILCEGETEENYFKGLISQEKYRRKFSSIDVDIYKPKDHSPVGLIKHAKDRIRQAKQERNEYNFIWVVFDKDSHQGIPDAFEMARITRPRIDIAFTIPCFEFFVLLHFCRTTKPFARCDDVVSEIRAKGFIPNYEKSPTLFNSLVPSMKTSLDNGAWVSAQSNNDIANGKKIYDLSAY